MSSIPISLRGNNLGERHRHFNSLVQDEYQRGSDLESILDSNEKTRLDKLFKIELASKHRNVDFIMETLKDEDMLFVSRALKCCTWLLESKYEDVINPEHLEAQLYPHMMTQAINKMKHWLQINLKHPRRCQQFYQYYSRDYDMKIKFLRRCSPDFIMKEILNIIDRVTPSQLRIICEYCPQAIKLYYDNFSKNTEGLKRYIQNQPQYFECSKYILNAEPDSYFEILEKYYDYERYGSLSPATTERIVKGHKQRVLEKLELFAAWLLDKNTLAKYLGDEEIKEVVLRLARAEYLANSFDYKFVEPFIKRIKVSERAAFKKKVFIDKEVGDMVKHYPYAKFSRPEEEDTDTVFDDIKYDPQDYRYFEHIKTYKRLLKKRKYQSYRMDCCEMKLRTGLDELFDRYRFCNYDQTMFELRKKLAAESSVKNREFMMLVLVSKCGENMEHLEKLIRFLVERYRNESSNLRATIVRSMAVRACVWRLPADAWSGLLDFGRDLGLDGASTPLCKEGIHAAVLRTLLSGEECSPSLSVAFLNNFSSLTEYKLSGAEKLIVGERLPAFLLKAATEDPSLALHRFELLFSVLSSLNKKVSDCPGAVSALVETVRRASASAETLLRRMYKERIARRELFFENFSLFQTNESYVNVLRHDATLLKSTKTIEDALKEHSFNYDGFLRKLALYFGEDDGLAAAYIAAVNKVIAGEPHARLARALALLRADLRTIISEYMTEPKGTAKRRLAAALQANYHLSDVVDVDATAWRSLGAKAVANRLLTCKAVKVDKYVEKCLEWRRTMKVALLLTERRGAGLPEIYKRVVTQRPGAALRSALSYFKRNINGNVETEVWSAVSPALGTIDLSVEQRRFLRSSLDEADYIPTEMEAEYWTAVFEALQRVSEKKAMPVLCRLENLLSKVNENVVRKVIEEFIERFNIETVSDDDYDEWNCVKMKVRIVGKYLMLGEGDAEQKDRLDNVWVPFCKRFASLMKENAKNTERLLNTFVKSLKYNEAFFDTRSSCLPVLERVATDLRAMLPLEGYFNTFVLLHVVMSYYKAIQYCLLQFPEKFDDERKKRLEGVTAVGKLFGYYIGRDLQELVLRYFKSITTLYQDNLMIFIRSQIAFNENRNRFITAIVGGLLEAGNTEALLVALHLLLEEGGYTVSGYNSDPERVQLLSKLESSENEEVKFFLYAYMYSGYERRFG